MMTKTYQLDGAKLLPWKYEGFIDEAVLVVPVGDMLVECGFRVMEVPSHVAPTDPPRAATMDEIAEVSAMLAEKCRVKADAHAVGQPRLCRRGWRSFLCDECGHKFEWPTRDHRSPSGENCPECGEWLFPHDSRQDETLKADDMGNLTYDLDVFPPANPLKK